jgi:hypothetical protein
MAPVRHCIPLRLRGARPNALAASSTGLIRPDQRRALKRRWARSSMKSSFAFAIARLGPITRALGITPGGLSE